MKISSRIIAKILTLCGISLTCTACYGVPMTDYMVRINGKVVADGAENGGESAAKTVKLELDHSDFHEIARYHLETHKTVDFKLTKKYDYETE